MPAFDVDPEPITVFDVGDAYVFSHYFEREDLFDELRDYYDREAYHFNVPPEDFESVRDFLEEHYYALEVVDDLEPYCVVKEQYTEHADILRRSVLHWTRRGHHFFVLPDDRAVEEAIERGATPIAETDLVVGI